MPEVACFPRNKMAARRRCTLTKALELVMQDGSDIEYSSSESEESFSDTDDADQRKKKLTCKVCYAKMGQSGATPQALMNNRKRTTIRCK